MSEEKIKYIVQCFARTYCEDKLNHWSPCPDVKVEAMSPLEAAITGEKIAWKNLAEKYIVGDILTDCIIEPDGKITRLVAWDGNMFPY